MHNRVTYPNSTNKQSNFEIIGLTSMKTLSKFIAIFTFIIIIIACSSSTSVDAVYKNINHGSNKNVEDDAANRSSLLVGLAIFKRSLFEDRNNPMPSDNYVKPLTRAKLDALDSKSVYIVKLGHSSILMKVYGSYWLIDPMFSERASPVSFVGPKRFEAAAISLEDLPKIDKVFISHNHYDHLDNDTIKFLSNDYTFFYVPKGVDENLISMGVSKANIKSLAWWQEVEFTSNEENKGRKFTIAFTPSQHFSGRTLWDRNATLWGSWVFLLDEYKLYFSGDTGYFDGFKMIGDKYGPFDVSFMENGAYDEFWKKIHMFPAQTVQAHQDLNANVLIPIHNSTFDLAFHDWDDPLNQILKTSQEKQVTLSTPRFGEIIDLKNPIFTERWWQ
ncbi:MBL fold metallo-hydrolase [Colwellia sp. RE-S-Sl-9]